MPRTSPGFDAEHDRGSAIWVTRSRLIALFVLAVALVAPARAVAAPELSVSHRLDDRRYVASGSRAYVVGTEAGRFPAMGFHTRGEMGGVWTPPLKLLDGLWFSIDGRWVGPATRFRSGYGYVEMDLPDTAGLSIQRVDLVPDGRRGALIGLRMRSTGAARRVDIGVDVHSELMSAYPWGETTPSQLTVNGQDTGDFASGRLSFREPGKPWAAVVGSAPPAPRGATGPGHRGPQDPPVVCPPSGPGQPQAPPRCDDTAYGRGTGGRLSYPDFVVPAGRERQLWIAVAGSDHGAAEARREFRALTENPALALRRKVQARLRLASYTRLSLPGDRLLQQGIEWTKQNLADSVQVAQDLQVREVNAGKAYPPRSGTVPRVRFLGAGFPDYPWLFATDGEYTAFASVAAGQFGPIKDHLRALRDVSRVANGATGKVVHEVVTDGSVYFGANEDAGNTDETVKFPSALALVWRWTGDDRFRDELYDFAVDGMRWATSELDEDGDGWLEGPGNVEREGMGPEKLDVAVYTIRGLLDLADMARAKRDRETRSWAEARADALLARFDRDWWMPEVPQHADSLGANNVKIQQRHWIGVTPMEAELVEDRLPRLGVARRGHGVAALDLRETTCYGDDFGLFHTGEPGCDPAPPAPSEKQSFTLNSAIMAVGEGNYGRLGPAQQGRYTRAIRRLQLPEPDEQPGAAPEIAPSPLNGRTIDRPFNERPMVLQAWGAYGTIWPVVHQQLGVRPDLGRRLLEVTPQVPPGQHRLAGRDIRIGRGTLDVAASSSGRRYRTVAHAHGAGLRRITLGHTLPPGAVIRRLRLDGRAVRYRLRPTNRGLEVLAWARRPAGRHVLVVGTR
jgi:hypothetical protein